MKTRGGNLMKILSQATTSYQKFKDLMLNQLSTEWTAIVLTDFVRLINESSDIEFTLSYPSMLKFLNRLIEEDYIEVREIKGFGKEYRLKYSTQK